MMFGWLYGLRRSKTPDYFLVDDCEAAMTPATAPPTPPPMAALDCEPSSFDTSVAVTAARALPMITVINVLALMGNPFANGEL